MKTKGEWVTVEEIKTPRGVLTVGCAIDNPTPWRADIGDYSGYYFGNIFELAKWLGKEFKE
jgi:hypothetical protein